MANEFVAKNGLISQNNTTVSGSLTVTQGITGSLQGTASNALTASFAPNYVLNSATSSFTTTSSFNTFTSSAVTQTDTDYEYLLVSNFRTTYNY